MTDKATGSDVARLAGVSKSAVSRAFTGGIVSDDARKRIFDAARVLKYRPSNAARALTTNRSRMIGIAVTHLDNQFYPEVVERLSDRFAKAGYRLLLFVTHGDADLEPMLDELLGYGLDGVILASSSMAARVAEECTAVGVPVVMFNNLDPEGRQPGISANDEAGGALVARYFAAAGLTRLAVITGLGGSTSSDRRQHGFSTQAANAGLAPPLIVSGHYTFEGAFQATLELLAASRPPEGLFCVNDHMAIGALHALHSKGIVPGRDVSVIGFDNVAIARWPLLSLTTLAQPLDEMVAAAVDMLLRAIAGRPVTPARRRFEGHLIVRHSARRLPGLGSNTSGEDVWSG